MTCGIYCRLSKEDKEKFQESESIQNQKTLLSLYAKEHGWDIYNIYWDEDYSGADRTRPQWNNLIRDAKAGYFEVILCKTQSRFTRDMELVEKYIHGLFPLWGIRFVTVVDHADTQLRGNKKARQINGLINEWYLEDLSENIRSVFDMKRKSGQYIGSFPIYGYQKDPKNKNHLIIDPPAAQIVKRIYELCLQGLGKQKIAALLNEQGIPNPTKYKQSKGWNYVNGSCPKTERWNRTTVGRILREQMYTGDLIQGRRKKASYKSPVLLTLPKEDWIIVPHAQEAVIPREVFDQVQDLLNTRTRTGISGSLSPLSGKVICAGCSSVMVKSSCVYKGHRRSYLRCRQHSLNADRCSSHSIRLEQLEQAVEDRIRNLLEEYYHPLTVEEYLKRGSKEDISQEISQIQSRQKRYQKALGEIYLDKSSGVLSQEEFLYLKEQYEQEEKTLSLRLSALVESYKNAPPLRHKEQTLLTWLSQPSLTRELAAKLIDRVEVEEKDPISQTQNIHIYWTV